MTDHSHPWQKDYFKWSPFCRICDSNVLYLSEKDVMEKFKSYIGSKVLVNKTFSKIILFGKENEYPVYSFAKEDTLIEKIKMEAKNAGLTVRTWLPGNAGTCDVQNKRLNIRVVPQHDGSYEITKIYLG